MANQIFTLDEHFCDCIGSSACDERLRWMESHVENALFKLFPVRGDLLNACLLVRNVPQPNAAVVRAAQQVQSVHVDRETRHCIQVGDHRVQQRAVIDVVESDPAVLVSGDNDWHRGMRDDPVDVFGRVGGAAHAVGSQFQQRFARLHIVNDRHRGLVTHHNLFCLVAHKVDGGRNTFGVAAVRVQQRNLGRGRPELHGAVGRS